MVSQVVESQTVVVDVLRHFYSDIQECIAHPGDVASSLFSEGVISEGVLGEAELSSKSLSERNAGIMRAIRVAVRADPRRVWVVIAVLEKFAESAPVARRMRGELESHGLSGE